VGIFCEAVILLILIIMIIQRKYYLEKIKKYIDIDIIKVITGIRRS
jgi:predicted AAA+ superfamily ATPase